MTINERDALLDLLNVLIRISFRFCGEAEKVELLSQWRESYDVLCGATCSSERPT